MILARDARQLWVIWATAACLVSCQVSAPVPAASTWVTVPDNAPLAAIAESLSVHGVVRSARSFRWYAAWSGTAQDFQPGVYDFAPEMPMARVAERLVAGVPPLDSVVILPGVTLAEAAPMLELKFGLADRQFWAAASDASLRRRLRTRGPTIEGYLFPGTYLVRAGETAAGVLTAATEAFQRFWTAERRVRLDSLGFARDEIITLASIVEGEVRFDFERPIVSSVYHNRLAAGMRLQADPTVIYALGERRRLFNRDYEVESPYNTYLIDGLPPHPINQPSAASIDAALYPASTDYLFFVAGPDGTHRFSSSYAEHIKAIHDLRSQ